MKLVDMYIQSLVADRKSENTIKSYSFDIKDMLSFIDKDEKEICYFDLINWKNHISNLSSGSMARKISSVKGYFKFLKDIEVIEKDPTEKLKSVKIKNKIKDYITMEDCKKMLSHTKNIRDKAIIALYMYTGLRVSELINFTLEQYQQEKIVINTKGDVDRLIYLRKECRDIIDEYIKVRKDVIPNLFVSNRGTPMRRECISDMLKVTAKRAGINKEISNHSLRYSFVSDICDHYGVDVAKEVVNHANIQTTMRYVRKKEYVIKNAMLGVSI